MDREETKKILGVIAAMYSKWKLDNPELTISVWNALLADYEYRAVGEALKSYIKNDTSGFAPVPGQLIERISQVVHRDDMTGAEAWSLVRKAISRGIYNSEEEYDKLPPAVKVAVGSPSRIRVWAMDEDFNEGVESSNFMRAYEVALKRVREDEKLTNALSDKFQNILIASGKGEPANA